MGLLTNITHYIPHIIQLKFSTNKYSSYYYQNWAAKLHYPHTKPNIIWLVGKTQRKPKIPKIPLRRGSFQKSHYNVANSKSYYDVANLKSHNDVANSMSHYDVANSKPATMRHYLQSLLLHGTSKARCYMAILYQI